MSEVELTQYLQKNDLIIVNKSALLDLMIEVNEKTKVDARVKFIDRKTAQRRYGVSRYWLKAAEEDMHSELIVIHGNGPTSPKKYNEQSIINELKRQSI